VSEVAGETFGEAKGVLVPLVAVGVGLGEVLNAFFAFAGVGGIGDVGVQTVKKLLLFQLDLLPGGIGEDDIKAVMGEVLGVVGCLWEELWELQGPVEESELGAEGLGVGEGLGRWGRDVAVLVEVRGLGEVP
jgi:hypothetical protein